MEQALLPLRRISDATCTITITITIIIIIITSSRSHLVPMALRSIIAPTLLDPLQLMATNSEFADGAHATTALNPLHMPLATSEFPGTWSTSPRARAALDNPSWSSVGYKDATRKISRRSAQNCGRA